MDGRFHVMDDKRSDIIFSIDDKVDNLLGILAVVCGNGSCIVLVLPKNVLAWP